MQEYRLNVKDDFVFKKIFSQPGNEKFLKEFQVRFSMNEESSQKIL